MKKLFLFLLIIGFSKAIGQTKNPFVYTNNEVKIELKIDGGKTALRQSEKNLVTIHFENLDSKTLTCAAPGLRILKGGTTEKPDSLWEINLANFEKKSYKLIFSYMKNNERFRGEFDIPIE